MRATAQPVGDFRCIINANGITIPSNVTSIGQSAFPDCATLAAITVESNSANYASADGVLFDKTQTTLIQFPGGKGEGKASPLDSAEAVGASCGKPQRLGMLIRPRRK